MRYFYVMKKYKVLAAPWVNDNGSIFPHRSNHTVLFFHSVNVSFFGVSVLLLFALSACSNPLGNLADDIRDGARTASEQNTEETEAEEASGTSGQESHDERPSQPSPEDTDSNNERSVDADQEPSGDQQGEERAAQETNDSFDVAEDGETAVEPLVSASVNALHVDIASVEGFSDESTIYAGAGLRAAIDVGSIGADGSIALGTPEAGSIPDSNFVSEVGGGDANILILGHLQVGPSKTPHPHDPNGGAWYNLLFRVVREETNSSDKPFQVITWWYSDRDVTLNGDGVIPGNRELRDTIASLAVDFDLVGRWPAAPDFMKGWLRTHHHNHSSTETNGSGGNDYIFNFDNVRLQQGWNLVGVEGLVAVNQQDAPLTIQSLSEEPADARWFLID